VPVVAWGEAPDEAEHERSHALSDGGEAREG